MFGKRLGLKSLFGMTLAVLVLSCTRATEWTGPTDDQSTAVSSGLIREAVGDLNLLRCEPLPYQRTVKTIGSRGGTIAVGRHSLVIPAGALRSSVKITAEAISDGTNSVRFSPEGLRFARSTRLVLDYSNCPLSGTLALPRKVVYTDELLKILELMPSLDYPRQKKVEGDVDHFSRYAVAW